MNFFNKISNENIVIYIFLVFFIKILFFVLVKNEFVIIPLGGGNDSDYYDAYALGYVDVAVNIWPVILRFLNDFGLYSREYVSYFLLFLNLFIVPILVTNLSNLSSKNNQKYYFYSFLLCLIYPTLFFYTFDVYRDVFMVFSFLVGCLIVKKSLNNSNFFYFCFLYLLAIILGLFLLSLRPYLGYAFLLALFLWKIKLTKKRIFLFAILYFFALFVANYIGVFEGLTEYREGFENELQGGSNLGLDFSNSAMFLPNFILSALGQLFGLYLVNPFAVLLFVIETIPILFMLFYIFKNIKYADSFMRFLIIFFVLYASVWLIGNDNLGTAVRLRMYNYLAIYICFFYILRIKNFSSILPQGVKK